MEQRIEWFKRWGNRLGWLAEEDDVAIATRCEEADELQELQRCHDEHR